jgi:SARP family transcriptional regulator, regulator of embCAB operon
MEALEARSNLGEALLAYDRLRRVLRDELGTVPGREIQAVHERLLGKA